MEGVGGVLGFRFWFFGLYGGLCDALVDDWVGGWGSLYVCVLS